MIVSATPRLFFLPALLALSLVAGSAVSGEELLYPSFKGPQTFKPGAHGRSDPHRNLDPEQLIKVALQHQAEGREVEAMTSLGEAVAQYPDNARLRGVRASLYLQQGKVTEALRDLEKGVSLDPRDPELRVNRAEAYRRFARLDDALADLDTAIELAPDMVAARFNRGGLHFARGDYGKAVADFEHAVAVDPHQAAPWFNLAVARESAGDRAGAEADLKRFLDLTRNEKWRKTAEETLQAWRKADGEKKAAN